MSYAVRILLSALSLQIASCSDTASQNPLPLDIATRDIVTGLDTPWEILWGPDGWIWMTERPGRINRVNPATGEQVTLLTINGVYEGDGTETGLLGMALHPSFFTDPFVYVAYNYAQGSRVYERLVRYRYNGSVLESPQVLLDSIPGNDFHIGARLLVAPDGKLFMTMGDTHDQPGAQDHSKIVGKTLRINLDGTVPSDNPWPGNSWPASLIWSTGHRNHQGLAFGPTGILYSSEHGPNNDDELNIIERGRNYGWPTVNGPCNSITEQGFCADSNVFEPMRAWTPTIAPAGMEYYGHSLIPSLRNRLLMTTLNNNGSDIRAFTLSADGRSVTGEDVLFDNQWGRIRDIAVAPDGRLFVATSNRDGRGGIRVGDDRIVEVTMTSSAAMPEPDEQSVAVRPHPIMTDATIALGSVIGAGTVTMYDLGGRIVREWAFEGGEMLRIVRDRLASGVYRVVVADGRKRVGFSIVVE